MRVPGMRVPSGTGACRCGVRFTSTSPGTGFSRSLCEPKARCMLHAHARARLVALASDLTIFDLDTSPEYTPLR